MTDTTEIRVCDGNGHVPDEPADAGDTGLGSPQWFARALAELREMAEHELRDALNWLELQVTADGGKNAHLVFSALDLYEDHDMPFKPGEAIIASIVGAANRFDMWRTA